MSFTHAETSLATTETVHDESSVRLRGWSRYVTTATGRNAACESLLNIKYIFLQRPLSPTTPWGCPASHVSDAWAYGHIPEA
jgi:hypothetical protein